MTDKEKGMQNAGEMFRAFMMQQGIGNEVKQFTKSIHDLYKGLTDEGFTPTQAMEIVLTIVRGGMK